MLRLKVERGKVTLIAVYAPEENKREESERFYEDLKSVMDKTCKSDFIIVAGDLNARVGNKPVKEVMENQSESTLNENGKLLEEFATFNQLKITNTFSF